MVLTGKGKPLFILFSIIIMTVIWSASKADTIPDQGAPEALIVVSPHPDDETIMAGGILYRAVHDGYTAVSAIYLSSGDGAGSNGKCFEVSVEEKKRKIVALREGETREAWGVIGLDASRLYFLRYSDRQLVAESHLIDGRRVDVLNAEGESAVAEIADLLFGWRVVKHIKSNAIALVKDKEQSFATENGIGLAWKEGAPMKTKPDKRYKNFVGLYDLEQGWV